MTKVQLDPGTFEPVAEKMIADSGSDMFDYHIAAIQLSQAASAKRSADALERIANFVDSAVTQEGTVRLENLLWNLGHNFGHGIEHGRKTS